MEYWEESWRLEETCCNSNSIKRQEDLVIRGQVETIQTTALLRTVRILRRVLETCGDLLSLKIDKITGRLGHIEQVETIQTTALLRTVRIPRRVLETWGDLLSLKLDKETGRHGHMRTSGNHPDYRIIKNRILIIVLEAWGDLLSLKLDKETGRLGPKRTIGNHPDYSIIKND